MKCSWLYVGSAIFSAFAIAGCSPQSVSYSEARPLNLELSSRVLALGADVINIRWTAGKESPQPNLAAVIDAVRQRFRVDFNTSDFLLSDDVVLAHSHYRRFVQLKKGKPIRGRSIRIWEDLENKEALQIEVALDRPSPEGDPLGFLNLEPRLNLLPKALSLARSAGEVASVRSIGREEFWSGQRCIERFVIKGKHGRYVVDFDSASGALIQSRYIEFPQAEYSLAAKTYPIWEFATDPSHITERQQTNLQYLQSSIHEGNSGAYDALNAFHFLYSKYDDDYGNTEIGQANGYWSNAFFRSWTTRIRDALPRVDNGAQTGKARLSGRYVAVYLNPDALSKIEGIQFSADPSPQSYLQFNETADGSDYEGKVATLPFGKPVESDSDVLNRDPAPNTSNNVTDLINRGFDEVQVYDSVNTLFETLHGFGFSDPELSTRPVSAILFDPSLNMRDNAYYDNDTINFTTYSPGSLNAARDNTTIWHELGHGVMDRLMGPHLDLADSGGLSEGMADFVAQIVIDSRTHNESFEGKSGLRIFNHTAFHLTNEAHDDGEAYGGAMNDLLELAIKTFGVDEGIARVADLTLETMRLTRDHPALTAESWFEHMVYADSLSYLLPNGKMRAAGELRDLIVAALASRNYSMKSEDVPAELHLQNGKDEVLDVGPGSRGRPVELVLAENESKDFELNVSVKDGSFFRFQYPVTIRASFVGGPLQGAVHWQGEDEKAVDVTLTSDADIAHIPVKVLGRCDYTNRDGGGCKDFVYVQILNAGASEPVAKKRFYVAVKNTNQQNE